MIRVFKTGRHAHRTPLSYSALAPLFADSIQLVDDPRQSDLYLFAHVRDIQEAGRDILRDWRARRRPVVLLSEEPFWDTIWTRQPLERHLHVDTRFGTVPVIQLTHSTSEIFDFLKIPYYLLTNHRFANAYDGMFTRNAGRSPESWLTSWQAAQVERSFMFERRPEPYHSVQWPAWDLIGLCAWRTQLAEAFDDNGTERLGRSWTGATPRWDLPDWHLDKLMSLDGRCRQIGAIENTHQVNYITEKIFDVFACGAIPLYSASPRHRLAEFGLVDRSWINLFGLTPEEGRATCVEWQADEATAAAYCDTQRRLAQLFTDPRNWVVERERLAFSLVRELREILDGA